ncbi:MAG: rhodanese-like domain-containing protein, partial [Bacteroidetes bacterium]|nr:rhodanese-like domain-containing protein [Bacteroidota bacterium]
DVLEVLPGHGAGSLCGAGMSKAKGSTLGAERETNAYLNPALTEEEFVAKILGTSPPFPQYYLRMKKLNSEGHKVFGTLPLPKVMEANEFMAAHTDGLIVDFREPLSFGAAHIEGSVNIPMGNQPSFWAAWMVQYDTPLYIIAEADTDIENITRCLIRVGLDDIAGYLRGGIKTWVAKGEDFLDIPQVSVRFLDDMMDAGEKVTVIDVRTENEFNEGHVKGAKHIYLGNLKERIGKFNPDDEIYCICGGGSRSAVAASVLQNAGFEMVFNVFGGMSSWKNAGLQVVATQAKENKTVTA